MPTNVKFLFSFRGGEGYGWSEVHFRQSSSATPDLKAQLNNALTNVVPSRVQLLGEDCAFVGLRVSYPTANGVASLGWRQFSPGMTGQTGAAAQLSLAINFLDASNTKHKICHLRGFWDAVEQNESYHPELVPGWTDALIAWKQALLVNAYGWLSRDPGTSAKGTVTNYVVSAEGIVTFTTALAQGVMPANDTIVAVAFSKINRSMSVLNKTIICRVASPTSLVSVNPNAATAFVSPGNFSIRVTSFIQYNDTGSISVGERRMGRPLFRSPGRSKRRATA